MSGEPVETLKQNLQDLELMILKMGWAYHRQVEQELSSFHLTLPQYVVLRYIHEHARCCKMSELAEGSHQVMPTMTGIIDRLEERGLVARERTHKDRRALHVSLTAEGQELLEKINAQRCARLEGFLEALTPEEQQSILQAMKIYFNSIHPKNHLPS